MCEEKPILITRVPILPLHFHSIKDLSEYKVSEVAESSRPEIIVLDAIVFIFNRRSHSQAGRRGFESRLPLQLFRNLADSTFSQLTFVYLENPDSGLLKTLETTTRHEGSCTQKATGLWPLADERFFGPGGTVTG